MKRIRTNLFISLILVTVSLSASLSAQKKTAVSAKDNPSNLPEVIWHDTGNVATLNLLYGAGGKEHAPDPNGKYTYFREDISGASPKFDVIDEHGVRWKVKLGGETKSETAATRLLWAAGYFVDEDYYLAKFKVTGIPKLQRGNEHVAPDGSVRKARLERKPKGEKKLGSWEWDANPFIDQKELNGLRVMMALLNNWDIKGSNNAIYEVNGERRYLASDVGATFGKTGGIGSRSKSDAEDFANSKFIETTGPDHVQFALKSIGNRARVTHNIPRAHAKWLGQRLAWLSEEQIRDAFRAGGYEPEDIAIYAKVIQKRIAELNAL